MPHTTLNLEAILTALTLAGTAVAMRRADIRARRR